MTPEQRKHLSELRGVVLTKKLVECEYYNKQADCYCVVGHMAKAADVIDELLKWNGDTVNTIFGKSDGRKLIEKIMEHYGLTFDQLAKLQSDNDSCHSDTYKRRSEKVLTEINNLLKQ